MNNPPNERAGTDGKPQCAQLVRAEGKVRFCLNTARPGTTLCHIHRPKDLNETVRRIREAVHTKSYNQ